MLKFRWKTEFKETEIGGIPRNWKEECLKEVAEINKRSKEILVKNRLGGRPGDMQRQ